MSISNTLKCPGGEITRASDILRVWLRGAFDHSSIKALLHLFVDVERDRYCMIMLHAWTTMATTGLTPEYKKIIMNAHPRAFTNEVYTQARSVDRLKGQERQAIQVYLGNVQVPGSQLDAYFASANMCFDDLASIVANQAVLKLLVLDIRTRPESIQKKGMIDLITINFLEDSDETFTRDVDVAWTIAQFLPDAEFDLWCHLVYNIRIPIDMWTELKQLTMKIGVCNSFN